MTSLVTIVMPVYKAEKYLARVLDGILAQTYRDWECLCVDDGSPDGSGLILDAYAARDRRFRVFHRQNAGPGAARNFGMDQAAGDFVMFSDADDVLHPQALETLIKMQRETNAELIRYGHREVREHTGVPRHLADNYSCEVIDFVKSRRAPTHYAYCGVFSFLTRDLADKVRWPCIPNGEDGLFAVRCLKASHRSVVTDCPLTDYLKHDGSGTQNRSLRMYLGIMQFFRLVTEECRSFPEFQHFKGDLRQYVSGGMSITPESWGLNACAEANLAYCAVLECLSGSDVFDGIGLWAIRHAIAHHNLWTIRVCLLIPHRLSRRISNALAHVGCLRRIVNFARKLIR